MGVRVVVVDGSHRVAGEGTDIEMANRFLHHLGARSFSPATVRASPVRIVLRGSTAYVIHDDESVSMETTAD